MIERSMDTELEVTIHFEAKPGYPAGDDDPGSGPEVVRWWLELGGLLTFGPFDPAFEQKIDELITDFLNDYPE